MHGGPKLLIITKKEMMGDEMPDFDGDSYVEAKKKMVMGDKDDAGADDKYSDDPHMAMKEMAKELYKASKMHAGQADKLMAICEELMGEDNEPHKAAGHNPHGKAKGLY